MAEINIHEAKTQFSRLLQRVAAGEEIIIARGGKPVARLIRYEATGPRQFGVDRGVFKVPEDFDAPLPDDALADFE